MHVLFLTPWYPNHHNPMDGLFARKHAQAIARQGAQVSVIRVKTDEAVSSTEVDVNELSGVLEVIVYTPVIKVPLLGLLSIMVNFVRGFVKAYKIIEGRRGKPDVTHVNVLTRMGVMAWALKKSKGIPYVVAEHWGRYMRDGYTGWIRRRATEIACRGAHCVMTVSEPLAEFMRKSGIRAREWKIVNNVVDDFFFSDLRKAHSDGVTRFICNSSPGEGYDVCKNIKGIIRSLGRLAANGKSVHLTIVGLEHDSTPSIARTVDQLGLGDVITFAGVVTPEEVSRMMHESDALVLFSFYETASCVTAEAMASGIPVIATPVGIVPLVVNEKTGIIVPIADEDALTEALTTVVGDKPRFDRDEIVRMGRPYSFESVGRFLMGVYADAIGACKS